MRSLLDVNVLVALLDLDHADHNRARAFVEDSPGDGWASCAITQNGFVRILTQPAYPSPVAAAVAVERLSRACADESHEFWSCDVSLLDQAAIDATRLHGPRQVTDAYLLALAVAHGGCFVTFDHAIPTPAVQGARSDNLITL